MITATLMIGNAQTTVLTPNGGEKWHQNGYYGFKWETGASPSETPILRSVYLDRYDELGVQIGSANLVDYWYLYNGKNHAHFTDLTAFSVGKYKFRIVEFNETTLERWTDESDGFFEIVAPLTVTCQTSTEVWNKEETLSLTVVWHDAIPGETYPVYLYEAENYTSEAYGFTLTNAVFSTEHGTNEFVLDFPRKEQSAWGFELLDPVDGFHVIQIITDNSGYIRSNEERVDVASTSIRTRVLPSEDKSVSAGGETASLTVSVDTRRATNSVRISSVTLELYQDDVLFKSCVLRDREGRPISETFLPLQDSEKYDTATVPLKADVTFQKGGMSEITLLCSLSDSSLPGIFSWRIADIEATDSQSGLPVTKAVMGVGGRWGPVVYVIGKDMPSLVNRWYQTKSASSVKNDYLLIQVRSGTVTHYRIDATEDMKTWSVVVPTTEIRPESSPYHEFYTREKPQRFFRVVEEP